MSRGETVEEEDTTAASTEHVSGARGIALARNTIFNLLGQGLPLIVALMCLPVIVSGLGADRFGVLALMWAVVGSVGALDLGLGRASARFISAALAQNVMADVPRILGTALLAEAFLGIAGGALVAVVAPPLVVHVFELPSGLQDEGRATLQLIAVAVPIVLLSSSLRGALFAAERFDLVNAVVVPASSSMYLLSTIGVAAGWSLPAIVALLVASKMAALQALWILAHRHCPGLKGARLSADRGTLRDLLRFGSWLTVSSLMVPFLTQAERLLIPALLSIGALTFYAVPYEAVSRAAVLPVSMALTLFPAFSRFDRREGSAVTDLVVRPLKWLLLVTTPAFAVAGLFARELLTAWIGPAFAAQAALPLRILAVAFYLSGFSHILRVAVQGLGRPDLKAKQDLANAGLFLVLLVLLTPQFGLAGAAGAKLIVSCAELAGLFLLAARVAPQALHPGPLLHALRRGVAVSVAFVLVASIAVAWLRDSSLVYISFGALTVVFLSVFWKWVSDATDRRAVSRVWDWLGLSRPDGLMPAADAEEPL